jgi:hypothetical protein
VGEEGEQGEGGGKAQYFFVPIPMNREEDRRGESLWGKPANPTPPPWQVGSVGVCGGGI